MSDSGRVVTREDIDLVLESMIRKETGSLRVIGLLGEVVGWLCGAGALVYAAVQLLEIDGVSFFGGDTTSRWRVVIALLLPQVLSILATGLTLVVLGRGARLFALHQAARRGMNVTGLTLGEPRDLEVDLEEDA